MISTGSLSLKPPVKAHLIKVLQKVNYSPLNLCFIEAGGSRVTSRGLEGGRGEL